MSSAPAEAMATWPFYTPPFLADVRGLPTAYRRSGEGEPLLYLHGAGLTRRWLPFYERLAQQVDLTAPEHPGFGDTPMLPGMRSMEDLVLHLDDLLEVVGLGDVHVVGHSLGGWLAAAFAVHYPRRVRSLTLIAPLGLRVPGHPLYDIFRMTPGEADEILFNGHAARYPEYLEEGDPVEALVHNYREITSAARLAFSPRYDVRFDTRLARVTCPALVIAAEDDRVVPRAHCERWAELLPDARLEVIRGAEVPTGHLPIVQEPDRLADLIAGFITTARGRA
jgi:pimeloyl-ACP methyl ester carboxylesterase